MRDPRTVRTTAGGGDGDALPERRAVRVGDIALFLRRYRWTLLAPFVALVALAIAYSLLATPLYTAAARLLVDARGSEALQPEGMARDTIIDAAAMESHVEAIQSERILLSAVAALETVGAPVQPRRGREDAEEQRLAAAERLRDMLTVRRVGQSRLIEVQARAEDPARAAQLANAVADAYVREQVALKAQTAGQAGRWLEQQVAEMGNLLNETMRSVQELKAKNDLVETGGRGLVAEQRVAERNSQLAQASAQTAEARARLERIEAVLAADPRDASVPEALRSEVITRLRQEYLDAATRETDLAARYGGDHPAVQRLRDTMRDLGAAIAAELRRIAETYRGEYEIARSREEAAAAALREAVERAAAAKQAQARLQELESTAEIHRKSYQKALERYAGVVQQQTFPIAEAGIVSPAVPPLRRSSPKPALAVALAGVLGLVGGLGAATVRKHLDRSVRRPQEVLRAAGVPCLVLVPKGPVPRVANALREVRTTLELARGAGRLRTVGIVPVLPGEGASTLAAHLAGLSAAAGVRTLLVDADLRRGSLTGSLGRTGDAGLAEMLGGAAVEPQAAGGGFAFLPAAASLPADGAGDRLGSPAFQACVDGLRERWDLILFDLPPLRAVPDARAAGPALDAVVVVAEYGRTPLDLLRDGVAALENAQVQVLGIVLNKVDPHAIRQELGRAVDYR